MKNNQFSEGLPEELPMGTTMQTGNQAMCVAILSNIDEHWASPATIALRANISESDMKRYGSSLRNDGLMRERVIPLYRDGVACGSRTQFRSV